MLKNRLLKPTLFLLLGMLLLLYVLFEIISAGEVEGWAYRVTHVLLPIATFMLVCDILLKLFVRTGKWILLIELFLSLGIVYYWIVS